MEKKNSNAQNQTKTFRSYSQDDLIELNNQLSERILEILDHFDISLKKDGKKYFGNCPIHEDSDSGGFNLYHTGTITKCHWKCRTHQCEHTFKNTLIGFIRGMLSRDHGWKFPGDQTASFSSTLRWCENFLGGFKTKTENTEKRKFVSWIENNEEEKIPSISREQIRKELEIPSPYFIGRGYSEEVLDRYDIGTCLKNNKPMSGRVVVPVYDMDDNFVGCTGRSIYEKCNKCGKYHDPTYKYCPQRGVWSKWRDSFAKENHLYNINRAKDCILNSGIAILVESPGSIWKLEEAGIHCGLGIFGASLTKNQNNLLNKTGALTIILGMDNDLAGEQAEINIAEQLGKLYNVDIVRTEYSDIGETPVDRIKQLFNPLINKYTL